MVMKMKSLAVQTVFPTNHTCETIYQKRIYESLFLALSDGGSKNNLIIKRGEF